MARLHGVLVSLGSHFKELFLLNCSISLSTFAYFQKYKIYVFFLSFTSIYSCNAIYASLCIGITVVERTLTVLSYNYAIHIDARTVYSN